MPINLQNKKKALPLHPQMSKTTEWVAACSKTTSTGFQHPMERWQSGRMHRSWKPAYWEVPGVRIPLSPLYVVKLWVPNIPEPCLFQLDQPYAPHGEMAEWSNAPVLKTGVLRGTGGSNPSLSATKSCKSCDLQDFFFFALLSSPPFDFWAHIILLCF